MILFELPPTAAVLTHLEARSLVLVLIVSAASAFLSRIIETIVLPTVVLEIVLGIIIGPQVLGWASVGTNIQFLANFGLATLFFFAGVEVVERHVPPRSIARGTFGWAISLAIGISLGYLLNALGLDAKGWLLGIALCTTALGTLVPILSDAGITQTPLGIATLGTGVAGEFWPITGISLFLTGVYGAGTELVLLLAFAAIALAAAAAALRARPPRLVAIIRTTLHTTGQAAVRLSIAILAVFVLLASDVGFDFVLGAFAAGLVVGLVLDNPEGQVVRMRIEGIGYGLLIPIYFVTTGLTFDITSLLTARGLALAALFLALLLLVRGTAALLWLQELGPRSTAALALYGATALPLIVAIVSIGTQDGSIAANVGPSLIGAGMISVLLYPFLAGIVAAPEMPTHAPAGRIEATTEA
jgi:Kef-type K+ transport system membrane component KefB